jgi:hypothetical protein
MNRAIVWPRPIVAGMLAAAVLCALSGAVSAAAGAAVPRALSHRVPVLNWLTDDLARTDVTVPGTAATTPPPPARPAARWRGADDPTTVPRDILFRSHITRISLPPPGGTPGNR